MSTVDLCGLCEAPAGEGPVWDDDGDAMMVCGACLDGLDYMDCDNCGRPSTFTISGTEWNDGEDLGRAPDGFYRWSRWCAGCVSEAEADRRLALSRLSSAGRETAVVLSYEWEGSWEDLPTAAEALSRV